MQIKINGRAEEVAEQLSAAQLLEQMGLGGKRLALEINRDIVPRSLWHEHRLNPGDEVEIVHAIGGG